MPGSLSSDVEENEASPASSFEMGVVLLNTSLHVDWGGLVVKELQPDAESGVSAVDSVHSEATERLDASADAECAALDAGDARPACGRESVNGNSFCMPTLDELVLKGVECNSEGCSLALGRVAPIEPFVLRGECDEQSWQNADSCEAGADADGASMLTEMGCRVGEKSLAADELDSRVVLSCSSDVCGCELDTTRIARERGHRGKGARAKGRVSKRLGRDVCEGVSATGNLADAANLSVCANLASESPSIVCKEEGVFEPVVELSARSTTQDIQDELALAIGLQRAWRRRAKGRLDGEVGEGEGPNQHTKCEAASTHKSRIEMEWTGRHAKKFGALANHVRFLQWLFRAIRILVPGAWGRRVPRFAWMVIRLSRRPRLTKCRMGQYLATDAAFDSQRRLSNEMLDWYGQYVAILRKYSSNEAPRVFDDFCGGGAVAEGIRRGGGVPFGLDNEEQPAYKSRFGPESFACADGVSWSSVRRLQKRHRLRLAGASPPCKWYSTARQKGESTQPPLIELTRDMLCALFDWWWIENVMGAQRYMSDEATEVDGPFFGLRVFRSRLFETNFKVHVDELVRGPADRLRDMCCLGERNRWRSFDEFGRPYLSPCCKGNVYVPIGDTPWRCTTEECAMAMGMDPCHMPYDRLAQAVPPVYSQWIFSQMCMQIVHAELGCPIYTFDQMKATPAVARRTIAQWLVGIGADQPSAGLALVPRLEHDDCEGEGEGEKPASSIAETAMSVVTDAVSLALANGGDATSGGGDYEAGRDSIPEIHSRSLPTKEGVRNDPVGVAGDLYSRGAPRIEEGVFRELYYAHFGGFDQQWSNLGDLPWLGRLRTCTSLPGAGLPTMDDLVGMNTYLEATSECLPKLLLVLQEAIAKGGRGTRALVVTQVTQAGFMEKMGLHGVDCVITYGGGDALAERGLTAAWCGTRSSPRFTSQLDHAAVKHAMDWRDRDEYVEDKLAKAELTWSPISHDPSLWIGKGLPADVESIMSEGVRIEVDADSSAFEVPQYPYPDEQSMMESLFEADRALSVGHMEYVPDEMIETILKDHIVHPWLMVWQGKWRLCQDYSGGTNLTARSGPFGLPSAWDAMSVLKPGSYMSKYDLRDFFWSIPVHPESRRHLVMRHPGTGRLMWCCALPFGYLDSPRQSCRVSEALAGEMRRRARGKGIHFFCYVDDYLVIGDDYELSLEGNRIYEEVMRDFGMQWAPAKHRGPVQYLEFLGLLLCNVEGHRCIALTESRQTKLREMIDEWLSKEPTSFEVVEVKPVDLAKLLGHLVFASQVVPGGRTFMQNMLSSFGGLEVDWKHGRVRPLRGEWGLVKLRDEFWLDLNWWRDHLHNRNCVPIETPSRCDAMITGTDASDWGVGTVVWLDGHKEECNLEFTFAEKRRPINFRELLGIVRIVELYGHRMRGCKVLIETDNMAARGAAEKLSSTAASMQEMIRRLYSEAERYGIIVVPIHTPGAKLFRPDQTSRGDPIEEPRLRLNKMEHALFEKRFGPFTEYVGAEREHRVTLDRTTLASMDGRPRIWMHPAHNTVGSALRLLGERLSGYDGMTESCMGPPPSGIVIVPYAPEAKWWNLIRHFTCIGRWECGDDHLEMNQLGR